MTVILVDGKSYQQYSTREFGDEKQDTQQRETIVGEASRVRAHEVVKACSETRARQGKYVRFINPSRNTVSSVQLPSK